MMIWLIIFGALSFVCSISMGIAWLLNLRSFLSLFLASAIGAGLMGAFFAQAGSAMATSVHPRDALLQGAAIGIALGMIWGGVCLGVLKITGKIN